MCYEKDVFMKRLFNLSLIVLCTFIVFTSCKTRSRIIDRSDANDTPIPSHPGDDITTTSGDDNTVGEVKLALYVSKKSIKQKLDNIEKSGYTYAVTPKDSSDSKCSKIDKKPMTSFNKTKVEDRLELFSIPVKTSCSKGYTIRVELLCQAKETSYTVCFDGEYNLEGQQLSSNKVVILDEITVQETATDIIITPELH